MLARIVVGVFLFLAFMDALARLSKLRRWVRHDGERPNQFTQREASAFMAYNIFTAALAVATVVALYARGFWTS